MMEHKIQSAIFVHAPSKYKYAISKELISNATDTFLNYHVKQNCTDDTIPYLWKNNNNKKEIRWFVTMTQFLPYPTWSFHVKSTQKCSDHHRLGQNLVFTRSPKKQF